MTDQTNGDPKVDNRMKADMSDVDSSGTAQIYQETVLALQSQMLHHQQRAIAILDPSPGQTVLEIGCGAGENLIRLAEKVNPHGSVIGIDISLQMLDTARRITASKDLPIEIFRGDARELDFSNASIDRVYAERVLQHLDHPRKAIQEMNRVLRSGGRVVMIDADYESLLVDCTETEVARVVARKRAEAAPSGRIGRQMHRLLLESKFAEVVTCGIMLTWTDYDLAMKSLDLLAMADKAVNEGELTQSSVESWIADLVHRSRTGCFFLSTAGFISTGIKR